MTFLQQFPMVSQLTAITGDGLPSNNAQFDCVAASIGAALLWLQGKQAWDHEINPDVLKDTVYGANYTGGTAASHYVAYCASQGVKLWAFNGMPGVLVEETHKQLQQGHPIIFTEPDPYVSASLGWTHVCVFYGEEQGWLTALDPYIGKPVRRTDSEWIQLLQFQQIWIVEKTQKEEEPIKTIELTDPMVGRYYELANADGTVWKCRSTGKIVQGAILAKYRNYSNDPYSGLTTLGLALSNEIPLPGIPGGAVKQYFERGTLIYDPDHLIDNPPGSGQVYALKLYDGGPGQDPAIAELEAELAQLKTQTNVALQAENVSLQGKIQAAVKDLS